MARWTSLTLLQYPREIDFDRSAHTMHTDAGLFNNDKEEEQMRTTLNIEDSLLKKAAQLTGIKEKTYLIKRGLETLISLESSRRLAQIGGLEKKLQPIPRRRKD